MTIGFIRVVSLALSVGLTVGGCEHFNETIQKVSVPPAVTTGGSDELPPVDLDTFPGTDRASSYYWGAAPNEIKRNALQDAIIARSQFTCASYRKELFASHVARKIGLQTLALGLTGAATAVTGAGAKTALAAAATGVLGVDQTIDAQALQRNAITAILNTITSERDRILREMRDAQKRNIDDYSINAAVTDAVRYNNACSLTEALSVLGTAVERRNANEETIRALRVKLAEIDLQNAMDALNKTSPEAPSAVQDAAKNRVDRADEILKNLLGTSK